jgi:CheY-like chemotaxis protein
MTKKQILIIDNDVGATALVKQNLERSGAYEVRTENMGTRGLAAAREFHPHLILLDVDMPDADGGEVAFKIRADKSLKDIPIVFFTSLLSDQEAAEGGCFRGGYEFLAKPASTERLIGCIEKNCRR